MARGTKRFLLLLGAAAVFVAGAWLAAMLAVWLLTVTGMVFTRDLSDFNGPFIAVMLVAGAAATAIYLGYALRLRRAATGDGTREKRYSRMLVLVPVIALGLPAMQFAADALRNAHYARLNAAEEARAHSMVDLQQARFQPTNLAVVSQGGGTWQAAANLTGKRAGQYRVAWEVVDGNFNKVLVSGTRDMALDGTQSFSASFGQLDLEQGYRGKVLHGSGNVLVDENFVFRLHVTPLLSDSEMAGLPGVVRTASARDQLSASAQASFPVRFVISS